MLGLVAAPATWLQYARHLGYLWLVVGLSGLLFRTVQLFVIRDAMTGLAWMTKILTDPFNDARLYRGAPLRLIRHCLLARTLSPDHEQEATEFHQ
jgi:hypothetical protein